MQLLFLWNLLVTLLFLFISWYSSVNSFNPFSPNTFKNSAGMLYTPTALLPFFYLFLMWFHSLLQLVLCNRQTRHSLFLSPLPSAFHCCRTALQSISLHFRALLPNPLCMAVPLNGCSPTFSNVSLLVFSLLHTSNLIYFLHSAILFPYTRYPTTPVLLFLSLSLVRYLFINTVLFHFLSSKFSTFLFHPSYQAWYLWLFVVFSFLYPLCLIEISWLYLSVWSPHLSTVIPLPPSMFYSLSLRNCISFVLEWYPTHN